MNIRSTALVLVALSGITASTASADNPRAPVCRIDVRSSPEPLGRVHLFLIHFDRRGHATYFRGGPETNTGTSGAIGGSSTSGAGGAQGNILVKSGDYKPGSDDYQIGAPSVTALTGPDACNKNTCFLVEKVRINNLHRPYQFLGPNSNSVAHTLLQRCGVPLKRPNKIAPGWRTLL